ncbi:CPBP family glutamic-type intramembrane protease [Flavobacterium sp.]|uniref:CPBP family glutamic-type intramembrane protease n=1 Tax=Flavobacterium sp. TaxID=239 RepID=UPI0026038465|nr:CPBP family glutamic-type intramembrane protease [Flavobacterium sp.]
MFLEQGVKKENPFWKYLVGSLVIFLASVIGQLPFGIALIFKTFDGGEIPTDSAGMLKMLDSNLSLFLIMLSFVFGLAGVFLVVKYFHKQTILEVTTSRSKIDWKRVFFSFFLWALFTIASVLVSYYLNPEEIVWNFKPVPFLILVLIGVIFIPIQTSTEEYVFRGYLIQGFANGSLNKKFIIGIFYSLLFVPIFLMLKSIIATIIDIEFLALIWNFVLFIITLIILVLLDILLTKFNFFETNFYEKLFNIGKSKLFPLLITSFIFGGMHFFNPEVDKMGNLIMVYYIGTGLFLGIITLMDDGMELALGFHAANNLVTALLVTSDWSALQTNSIFKDVSEPSAGLEIIIPVFVVFPLLLLLFGKKYKWTDWKEKLTGEIKLETNSNEINND